MFKNWRVESGSKQTNSVNGDQSKRAAEEHKGCKNSTQKSLSSEEIMEKEGKNYV